MPSFFDDSVRHMVRQLAATYRAHHLACHDHIAELEAIVVALRAELEADGSAATRALSEHAQHRLGLLRESTETMGVLAARPRERHPLSQVVEAAQKLASSTSKRPLNLTVDGSTDGDEAQVIDAAYNAQRLASELTRMAERTDEARLRWSRERSLVVLDLTAEGEPTSAGTMRIEMATVDPLSSGVVPRMDGLRVLAVDDDPTIRNVVERCLRHGGHRVHTAVDVDDAMRWVSRASFDAVVTDVEMPGGGGFELLRRLQSERPQLAERLTFLTGLVDDPLTRERLVASGRPHLGKPFDDRALLAMIVRVAAKKPRERERGVS